MNRKQLRSRKKRFAHDGVRLALSLPRHPLAWHVRRQLIRASTSVAANYRAAILACRKAAFAAKISIVLEEADESRFWLEFLVDESVIPESSSRSLMEEADELVAIFFSTRRTSRR